MRFREKLIPLLKIAIFFLILLCVLTYVKKNTQQAANQEFFLKYLSNPMKYDDPLLIKHITENVLTPPSKEPYNLAESVIPKRISLMGEIGYFWNFTQRFLALKRGGFFVEAGALDGELASNTLGLEVIQGWSGLLVEPDPISYKALRTKQRKAWTVNACLSMHTYPSKEFISILDENGIIKNGTFVKTKSRASSFINHKKMFYMKNKNDYFPYPCQSYPLGSLLMALNVTKVDLLSLDIQGIEKYVLLNFDFNKFDIEVIYLEWMFPSQEDSLYQFMEGKKFILAAKYGANLIFVKQNTKVHRMLLQVWNMQSKS